MITNNLYYKHTIGNAFTLSGVNYTGFFNIQNDGSVWTGTNKKTTSQQLSTVDTLLSEFYVNKNHFNRSPIIPYSLSAINMPINEILTKLQLQKIAQQLKNNNLLLFQQSVIFNKLADFSNCVFYGLSSSEYSGGSAVSLIGRREYMQTEPFSYSPEWSFLETAVDYSFVPKTDGITIFLTTSSNSYMLSAAYDVGSELKIISDDIGVVPNTKLFAYENSLLALDSDYIYSYQYKGDRCNSFVLKDKIRNTFGEFIKFTTGNNYRGFVSNEKIQIYNRYNWEPVKTYHLSSFSISSFSAIDIDPINDNLIIASSNALFTVNLREDINTIYKTDIVTNTTIKDALFTRYDCDLFYVIYDNKIEIRSLSNPKYPIGIIDENNYQLLYPQKYIWNLIHQKWEKTNFKWNTNGLRSNNFATLLSPKFYFNENDNKLTLVLYNYGRIYITQNSVSQLHNTLFDVNITTKTIADLLDSKSYVALHLNEIFGKLLDELLYVINSFDKDYKVQTKNLIPYLDGYEKILTEIAFFANDYFFHENEELNSISFYRVVQNLYNLQEAIFNALQRYTTENTISWEQLTIAD